MFGQKQAITIETRNASKMFIMYVRLCGGGGVGGTSHFVEKIFWYRLSMMHFQMFSLLK
jgi:hypothetical protein